MLPEAFVRYNREHFVDHIRPTEQGCAFETANGLVKPEECVDVWVQQLRKRLEFIIMKDCPKLLSMGKLVLEQGLAFHWVPGKNPYLEDQTTKWRVELEVENDTPVLPRHLQFLPDGWLPLVNRSMCPLRVIPPEERPKRKPRRQVRSQGNVERREDVGGSSVSDLTMSDEHGECAFSVNDLPSILPVRAGSSNDPEVAVITAPPVPVSMNEEDGGNIDECELLVDELPEPPAYEEQREERAEEMFEEEEYENLCFDCGAPFDEQFEIIEDGAAAPDRDVLAAFAGSQTKNRILMREAKSVRHQLNHEPKNPYCVFCQSSKLQRRRRTRKTKKEKAAVAKDARAPFGTDVRMDPVMDEDPRLLGLTCGGKRAKGGLFIYDRSTDLMNVEPLKSKEAVSMGKAV